MNLAAWAAFTVGWLKGGHPERFGVAVLLSGALIELFMPAGKSASLRPGSRAPKGCCWSFSPGWRSGRIAGGRRDGRPQALQSARSR